MTSQQITAAVLLLISVPGVVAIVTRLRKVTGIAGAWATLLALVVGWALNLAAWWTHVAYASLSLNEVAWLGFIAGLGAAGIYDVSAPKYDGLEAVELKEWTPPELK